MILSNAPLLIGWYDYRLVALSVVIAIFASYAALDLAGRVTAARGTVRAVWLWGGAVAMGLGIWSMHYIGMLAFSLPIPVFYDWPTVALSLLAAILASAVALYVVSRRRMGTWRAAVGSVPMGLGIAAMHYTGMAAMRLSAMCGYNIPLVTLSVVLAVVISFVALCLAFLSREERKGLAWRKIASAVVMGAAIPVMHYTAMAAARFMPMAEAPDLRHAVSISALGTTGIAAVTLLVLGLVVLTLSRSVLAESGYVVLEADRPEKAIEIARTHRGTIDLLLTDMVMPGMNGRTPAQKVAALRPDTKVLYTSGYTGFSQSALVETELVFLPKPFTKESLLAKVRAVLTSSAELKPV